MKTWLWVLLAIVLIVLIFLLGLLIGRKYAMKGVMGGSGRHYGAGAYGDDYVGDYEGADDADGTDADDDASEGGDCDIEGGKRRTDIATREPYFKEMIAGKLNTVLRLNKGVFKELKPGETIQIRRSRAPDDKTEYPGERRFKAKLVATREYKTLDDAIKKEGAKKLGMKNAEDALKHYREFTDAGEEAQHGIIAIEFEKI